MESKEEQMRSGEKVVSGERHYRLGNRGLGSTAPLSPGFLAGVAGICDVAGIVLAGISLQLIGWRAIDFGSSQYLGALAMYTLLSVLAFNSAGFYRFNVIVNPLRNWGRFAAVLTLVFAGMTALAFAFKVSADFSRLMAFSWLFASIAFVCGLRWAVAHRFRSLARAGRLGRRILIYGVNDQSRHLIERIEALNEPWNQIVGVFDDRKSRAGPTLGKYPVLGNLGDLVAWGRTGGPDDVLVALPWSAEDRIVSILNTLAVLPVNIRLCPETFNEAIVGGRTSRQYGLPMVSVMERPLVGWNGVGKRLFDIVFSTIVLLFAAPLMLLIGALIRLESPGPVLFRQKRFGFNDNIIDVYKFRTMYEADGDPAGDRFTARDDPRVTRIGAILRRSSLDELPQIINVLRGEMSLIGPRPHALRTTAGGRLCEDVVDRYSARHRVKPGITGWAQVNGYRGTMQEEAHLRKRIEHDLYYIKEWSPLLDVKILFMTLWIVVNGRNSY